MVKYKDLSFTAIIIVFAAVVNIYEVKNVIFELFPGHEQSRSVSEDVFGAEIMKLINSSEYSEIDEKFASISSNSTELKIIVEKIVNEIDDFHTSLEFAKKIKNPEISYLVLKNLWFEINSKNDTNLVESMNIYRTFHSKVIDVAVNEDDELKSSAIKLCEEEIRLKIQNESVIQLKSFLLPTRFDEIKTKRLLELLFQTSEQIFDDVNQLLIDEIYEILPQNELFYRTFLGTAYAFPMNVFSMLHLILKNSTILEHEFFDFGIPFWTIGEKRIFEKNHNLSDFTKNKYEELLNYFSPEMKTLLLSENLCFRNYISNEYICEASKSSNDSQIERTLQKTEKCIWKIDYSLNNEFVELFSIQHSNHSGEYLFVELTKMQLKYGTEFDFENWEFKKDGNVFKIYNTIAEIYLCISDGSDSSTDSGRREVSLMKERNENFHHDKCRWKVESC